MLTTSPLPSLVVLDSSGASEEEAFRETVRAALAGTELETLAEKEVGIGKLRRDARRATFKDIRELANRDSELVLVTRLDSISRVKLINFRTVREIFATKDCDANAIIEVLYTLEGDVFVVKFPPRDLQKREKNGGIEEEAGTAKRMKPHVIVEGDPTRRNDGVSDDTLLPANVPDDSLESLSSCEHVSSASRDASSAHSTVRRRVMYLPFSTPKFRDAVVRRTYARVGLLGNPSDGYGGKTISFTVREFYAQAVLVPENAPVIRFIPNAELDGVEYRDAESLLAHFNTLGYDGGLRLVQAACKVFFEMVREERMMLPLDFVPRFSLAYTTNIQRTSGLAGSSAIVCSVFRVLLSHLGFERAVKDDGDGERGDDARFEYAPIPGVLANYVLRAEQRELGIAAGLQDRVAQCFEGLTFMDFSAGAFARWGGRHGDYVRLPSRLILGERAIGTFHLVSYRHVRMGPRAKAKTSGGVHSGVRARFESGDEVVRSAMRRFAELAEKGKKALETADRVELINLMNANFDMRCELFKEAVSRADARVVAFARSIGAGAKLPGSGGVVLVFCPSVEVTKALRAGSMTTLVVGEDEEIRITVHDVTLR